MLQLTVCVSVDSAFPTSTKTSASKQCLSIQVSKSGDTSIPGLERTCLISTITNWIAYWRFCFRTTMKLEEILPQYNMHSYVCSGFVDFFL